MGVPQWDPDTCPKNFSIAVIAKRRSGKSTWLKHMCYEHWRKYYPYVEVFTDTKFNGFYQDFVDERCIHEGWDEVKVKAIMDRQRKMKAVMQKLPRRHQESVCCLIILDDVLSVRYSHTLEQIMLQGRHFDISVVCCLQDATILSKKMRDNLDVIVSFRQANKDNRERLVHSFMAVTTYEEGEKMLMDCTCEDYCVCVIDNTMNAYNLQDFVYWHKVDEVPPQRFKMGCNMDKHNTFKKQQMAPTVARIM